MSKIALVQFKASTDKKKNLPKIIDYIKQAAKNNADMCTFPEYMMFYTPKAQTARQVAQEAETINGEFVSAICDSARKNSIAVVGTMYEKSRKKDRVYDTSFIVNKSGKVTGKYRKIHLFDITTLNGNTYNESDTVIAGNEIVTYDAENFSIGCSICYDLRFAELYLRLAKQNVDIIMVPASFTLQTGKDHWSTLLRARAIETQSYVIAPGQCGEFTDGANGIRQTWGHSMIIDPWGHIVAQVSDGTGWATCRPLGSCAACDPAGISP